MNQSEPEIFGEKEWKHLQIVYTSIYKEIMEHKNLDKHLKDIEQAIKDLDEVYDRAGGQPTPRLDEIKNDYYFLKFQILERL